MLNILSAFKLNLFFRLALINLAVLVGQANASDANIDMRINEIEKMVSIDHNKSMELISSLEADKGSLSKEQFGKLLILKGLHFLYSGNLLMAQNILSKAEKHAVSIQDLSRIFGYQMTAAIGVNDYRAALVAAKKQLKVVDHLIEPSMQFDIYLRMANFYYNLGANSSSLRYLEKAKSLSDEIQPENNCFLKIFFAANSFELSKIDVASEYSTSAVSYCQSIHYKPGMAISQRVLGEVQLVGNLLDEAQNSFISAIQIYRELNFQNEVAAVNAFLAEIYFLNLEFIQAKELALGVINEEDSSSLDKAKHKSYQVLSNIYHQEGNYKKAFESSKKAQEYQQKIYDDEKIKTLAYEAAKFDFEELEDFIQKNENTEYISSGRELLQIDREMDLLYDNKILKIIMILCGTTVFTSTYMGVCSYRRNRYNPLTGLLRHDAASKMSKDLFHDAMYLANGFAVLAVDIDRLKDFNRILGHEHADWVITQISAAIKKFSRFKKAKGSYSGNGRFYVYLELLRDEDAFEFAQKLAEEVNKCNTFESKQHFNMTVSIGVACLMQRAQGVNDAEVRRWADVALQVAKDDGGDEIIKYQASFDEADEEHKKQLRFVHFIDPKLMVRVRRF